MRIIPAIDIIDGKSVRLRQGDFTRKTIYNEDPLEVAKQFEDNGLQYLHLVDLDGARSGSTVNLRVLETIARCTQLKIDFGGGIQTNDGVRAAFEYGASQVTIGSTAVKNKALFLEWLNRYQAQKIILGADVKHKKLAINGWLEQTSIGVFDFIGDYLEEGIQYVMCTDIARDGLLSGSSIALYRDIISQFPDIKLIASGGVTSIEELSQLKSLGTAAVIIGKAIYEGKISLKDLGDFAAL